jgi:hypothetical protein
MCKDTVNSEMRAPDGVLVATWFTRNCGATTDYATTVNVHRADSGFRDDSGTVFVAEGRHQLDMKWLDAKHLSIECDGCRRKQVFRTVTILGDTDVTFLLPAAGSFTKQ